MRKIFSVYKNDDIWKKKKSRRKDNSYKITVQPCFECNLSSFKTPLSHVWT